MSTKFVQLLTAEELAVILNVSVPRAYALLREGVIPSVHLNRQVRVDPAALDQWLKQGGQRLPGGWRQEV